MPPRVPSTPTLAKSAAERRLAAIQDPTRETPEARLARERRERIEWEWRAASLMARSETTMVDDPMLFLEAAEYDFDALAAYFRRFCKRHPAPAQE